MTLKRTDVRGDRGAVACESRPDEGGLGAADDAETMCAEIAARSRVSPALMRAGSAKN